jgi:hypothetical protein
MTRDSVMQRMASAGIIGEGKRILETTGANICFSPSDAGSFKNALVEIISNMEFFERNAKKNPEFVLSNYNRNNSGMLLTEVFSNVIEKP